MGQNRNLKYFEGAVARPEVDVASATKAATFTSPSFAVDDSEAIVSTLAVTAASGTSPTLNVALEVSYDGGTTWFANAGAFAQATGVTSETKSFLVAGATHGRWKQTIGGTTPSFTYSLGGSKHIASR